ncbi:speckle-type POZ protein B-like isoform X4 [Planococcus citri]|uniref:speckle-type POZ protein B-like isoform X4 n=1 Tax=Planococcus citri TaxID=170843 RepID=UPI0031F74E66
MSDLSAFVNNSPSSHKDSSTENWCCFKSEKLECEYTWIIQNFNLQAPRIVRTKLISSEFSAPNDSCKWFMSLEMEITSYSSYNCPTSDCWLSIVICRSETTNSEPRSGNVDISLMDLNNEKSKTLQREFFVNNQTNNVSIARYVKFRDLLAEDGKLLPKGELRIYCKLSYVRDIGTVTNHFPLEFIESNPMRDFEKLFNDDDCSDVVIDVNGKSFPAHKVILAARSPVFKAMFKNNLMENQQNRVEIKDADENVFQEVLRYIYTGKVENLNDIALELMLIAEKYDLAQLKGMCLKVLGSLLSVNNVVKILIIADLNNAHYLKTQAVEYIRANVLKVMRSKDWTDLNAHPDLMNNILDVGC